MKVEDLILNLEQMKSNNAYLLTSIYNFDLLIEGLSELNKMIEIDDVKSSIIIQIKFLLVNSVNESKKKLDGHMLHTVLSGKSGCGKTALGVILAKIWIGLGLIKKPNIESNNSNNNISNISELNNSNNSSTLDNEKMSLENKIIELDNNNKTKIEIIKRLQSHLTNIKTEIKDFNLYLNNYRLRSLKRDLIHNNIEALVIDDIIKDNDNIMKKCKEITSTYISDENVSFALTLLINKRVSAEDIKEIKETNESDSELIKIVSREDFVGGYLGQTAIKTEKLLRDNFGKILFIDEAYSLINDDKDSFGMEALTVINRFMSEFSDSIIIIFAGYKDMLDETIFKAQPGLKRRCSWYFDIKGYSDKGLAEIFKKQLCDTGWSLSKDLDLISFFKENKKEFPNYGGNTLQLAFYCKLIYSSYVFDKSYENHKIINHEILQEALNYLKNNQMTTGEIMHTHIYL